MWVFLRVRGHGDGGAEKGGAVCGAVSDGVSVSWGRGGEGGGKGAGGEGRERGEGIIDGFGWEIWGYSLGLGVCQG